ncbi:MAG TPA: monofunctional biosynthetic peptidoglycan transglycosylase [Pseudolabrys sp.]|nr:monofunctional biosynthetic peptidoglycan transglycosylase [Pseudolabrys sp.]
MYVVLVLLLLPYALTPLYAVVNPPSTLMLWRLATGQRVERTWVPLAKIDPDLPLAVIVAEDGRFCSHFGIDLTEIQNALDDAEGFDDVRGGSTITQQVAKNLFLWQGRSYVRKALELPLALWIDLVLPKSRVLEIYLNIAEMGPDGEFGAEEAAKRAFGRSAGNLSANQAALLAATLPNPATRDARQPGPGLRRLAGLYQRRAASAPSAAACVRPKR